MFHTFRRKTDIAQRLGHLPRRPEGILHQIKYHPHSGWFEVAPQGGG